MIAVFCIAEIELHQYPLLDVLIGFEHVNYSASETAGQLMINITVLDGILTYPISVAISTSDGTAFGKYWMCVAKN